MHHAVRRAHRFASLFYRQLVIMQVPIHQRMAFIAILWLFASPAFGADPVDAEHAVSDVLAKFTSHPLNDTILEAAKSLFWTLATISLVWTMGMLIVRQDIGELLMELLRFIVVTGIFYWILINASSRQGGESFVEDIVRSFLQLASSGQGNETVLANADSVLMRGLHVYYLVINDTGEGQDADRLISGAIAVSILCICAVMAAQALLALVMAWILGYAGIFLLGFGGARWTSPIAINFYKHVVAVGAALLALSIIGTVAAALIDSFGIGIGMKGRTYVHFPTLGLMLAVSIFMMLLSIKVPQLIYTLVTGSTLGIYAGSASAAGTAIATAGSSAYAAAVGRLPGGGVSGGPSGAPGGPGGGAVGIAAPHRADSVMDAVHRSASVAGGMADPFHVTSGTDPFGVGRAPDTHRDGDRGRSVFGDVRAGTTSTTSAASMVDTIPDPANASGNATSTPRVQSRNETTRSAPERSVTGQTGTQTSSIVAAESVPADAIRTGISGVESSASVIDQRGTPDHGGRRGGGVSDHGEVGSEISSDRYSDLRPPFGSVAATGGSERLRTTATPLSDIPVSTDVDIHRDGSPTGSETRAESDTVRAPHSAAAPRAANNRDDVRSSPGSSVDVHSVGTFPLDAGSEQSQSIRSAQAVTPPEPHIDRDTAVSTASQDVASKSTPTSPHTHKGAPAKSAVMQGTPTSTVQEDMRPNVSIGESVEVLPGATTAPPAPEVDTHADPTPTDASETQPPRRRKRRVRRWPDEDHLASLPPTDTMSDAPAAYDDEKSQDDPT